MIQIISFRFEWSDSPVKFKTLSDNLKQFNRKQKFTELIVLKKPYELSSIIHSSLIGIKENNLPKPKTIATPSNKTISISNSF